MGTLRWFNWKLGKKDDIKMINTKESCLCIILKTYIWLVYIVCIGQQWEEGLDPAVDGRHFAINMSVL